MLKKIFAGITTLLLAIGLMSVASPAYAKTVPGAPTGVSATAGNKQASVSWTAPASEHDSDITSYTVTSTPGGLTGTSVGAATTAIVTGLTNGTSYTFTVTATNEKGPSTASTASTAITPSTVPGAPTGVRATAGNKQASVSWTAPASNGGSTITSYTVTSSPGSLTATTAGTSATITGLTNGTAYTFTVTATNAAGTSTASGSSAAVRPTTGSAAPAPSTPSTPSTSTAVTLPITAPSIPADIVVETRRAPAIPATFLPSPPPAGGANVLLGGRSMTFEVTANQREGNVQISGGDTQISLSAQSPTGTKLPLDSDGTAILNVGGVVASSGSGFLPGSAADFYLMTRDTATFFGSLDVLGDGTFEGAVPIPSVLAPGTYTLQVNGLAEETHLRSHATIVRCISILVRVKEPVSKPAVKGKAVRGVVYFDAYSAKLTKSAKHKLDAVVKRLPTKSNNLVRVVGFVGRGGSIGHVKTLSKKRTKSVKRYLRSKGVRGKYVLKVGGNASGASSALRAKIQIIPNKGT